MSTARTLTLAGRKFLYESGLSIGEVRVCEAMTDLLGQNRDATGKEIAMALFVTEKTVKFHKTNIYRKLRLAGKGRAFVALLTRLSEDHREVSPPEPIKPSMLPKGSW